MTDTPAQPTHGSPAISPGEVLARVRRLRWLFLDVDGVMTDGGLYYGAEGEALKRFHVLDGHGIKALQAEGISTGVISGRSHPAVTARAQELGMGPVYLGVGDKLACFQGWLDQTPGATPDDCAHMGDDLADLGLMKAVGLALTVPHAAAEVLAIAHWTSQRSGGHGAVRDAADFILRSRQ